MPWLVPFCFIGGSHVPDAHDGAAATATVAVEAMWYRSHVKREKPFVLIVGSSGRIELVLVGDNVVRADLKRQIASLQASRQKEEGMTTVSVQEAQARLSELIHQLTPEEVVVITEDDQPIARLVAAAVGQQRPPRRLGTLRGTVLYMAPDFDAPLQDFEEYMP